MIKTITIVLFVICLPFVSSAQGSVKGKIIDSATGKPLGYATVTVFESKDTVLQNYRISTPEGDFAVPGLPTEKDLRLLITFTGYAVYRQEFRIQSGDKTLDIGTVKMLPDATSLDEVLVISERPPIVVRRDTVEFNASSFRTLPNALVEDLLKKLPGVQVDRDGNITVNGRPVNRIQVDGKTFFGDDPKMATRNLPANVIDKIQVTDDKEEMMRNGDDNLNNVGKVINLTLKKAIKKGWFGKLYAGGGTDDRYEVGGIANIYRDTLQISVLGYMNNLNRTGFSFSELMQAGGLQRSRSNSASNSTSIWNYGAGGSGIQINGVSFGGAQGQGGVSTSRGAGFNLNHAPNAKKSLYLQYFFGNVLTDRETSTLTDQFRDDTIVTINNQMRGRLVTNAHNIGTGGRFKPDSVTTILLNANYTIGLTEDNRLSNVNAVNNKLGDLSEGLVAQQNDSRTYYYRHTFLLTRLSRKKAGRRFNLSHNLDMNNRYNDYLTESEQRFYAPLYDSFALQTRVEKIPRTDASVGVNYSEPLSKALTLRTAARYEISMLKNRINTYDQAGMPDHNELIPALSSAIERTSNLGFVSAGLEFKLKDLLITPAARLLHQDIRNDVASMLHPINQNLTRILPSIDFRYKTAGISFSQNVVLPSYAQIIPVVDNTNPYFIMQGNPNLRPIRRTGMDINYQYNNTRKSLNASLYGNGSIVHNDIVQNIVVNDKGVQTVTPVNATGSRNLYANFNVYKQYKNRQKFQFSWNFGGGYNYNRNRLFYNGESSWQSTFNLNHWAGINLNWNDIIEFNPSLTTGHNFTRYTSSAFPELKVRTSYMDNELIVRWPKHIIWETTLNIVTNSNVPPGQPKEVSRLNGAVNVTLGKSEASVIKLTVFDIFDNNRGLYTNVNRNLVTRTNTNVLEQYVMLTFTHNVRPGGVKKKVGGRERFNIF